MPQISTQAPRGHISAVLGPTNTGKTHLAVERMLGHSSGIMGFPLRLLAREVYDRVVAIKGPQRVALMTGEEKIVPPYADYFLCTTESMPRGNNQERDFAFVGIDEVQMAADPERGHVFTQALLHARGTEETMLMGAGTMAPLMRQLVPKAEIVTRERLSKLSYVAPKKLSRLPRRTALVAFSIEDVYAHAELLRRQKGGCAIVMGALSPRTRNAQVELYQNGDVDYLVATDAIGMGLNMDIDMVAFASRRKYDGRKMRDLTRPEIAQIAGRAGRHMSNGSFTTLMRAEEVGARFSDEDIRAVEEHEFQAIKQIFWRTPQPDYGSLDKLIASLEAPSGREQFLRARYASDVAMLKALAHRKEIAALAGHPNQVKLLWDVCQVPDFRKLSGDVHARLLGQIFTYLSQGNGTLPDRWVRAQIDRLDNVAGDIDTLAARIAAIRIWTFIAHRPGWLDNAPVWTEATRAIEDRLSDGLHERLTQRFVDRRTSILLRQLKDKGDLMVDIQTASPESGSFGSDDIVVEGHLIGTLKGFNFTADAGAPREDQKMLRAAADKALRTELDNRAKALSQAKDGEFTIDYSRGFHAPRVKWRGATVADVTKGTEPLTLHTKLLGGAMIEGPLAQEIVARMDTFLEATIGELLEPLVKLRDILKAQAKGQADVALGGTARGVAFRLVEQLGILPRGLVQDEVKALDQAARRGLRTFKIRFGANYIFMPPLLKPAATDLRLALWAMEQGHELPVTARPSPGLVWIQSDKAMPRGFYQVAGFKVVIPNAVRIDMFERLADAVRPLGQNGARFPVSPDLMGYVGASGTDFENVMSAMGYKAQTILKTEWEAELAAKAEAEKPAEPEEATAPEETAQVAADETPSESDAAPEGETAPTENAAAAPPEPAAQETPATEPTQEVAEPVAASPEAEGEAAQPEKIVIFQWAGRKPKQNNRGRRPQGKNAKPNNGGARNAPKGQRKGQKARSHSAGPQKEKPIDPDSPFAALAGLKEKLLNK